MLKIWGRATSSNVQAVMWSVGELGLEFERYDRGHVHGGLNTAEFLALNPHGLIPVIKDGNDAPIWESATIVLYLLAQYGDERLWPKTHSDRAQIEMWGDWVKIKVTSQFTAGVFWPVVRTPKQDRDEAKLQQSLDYLAEEFLKIEKRLTESPFMSGEHFGYADIMLGHLL